MSEAELEAQQRSQKTHGIIVSRRESVVFLSVQPNNQSKPNSHKERRLDNSNFFISGCSFETSSDNKISKEVVGVEPIKGTDQQRICNGEAEADGRSGGSSHEDEVEDGASFWDVADCRLNKAQLGEDNVHVAFEGVDIPVGGSRSAKTTPSVYSQTGYNHSQYWAAYLYLKDGEDSLLWGQGWA
ncbi:hypothetical protein K435DRAFT_808831 [Dendrothele bispora CBS 962.96]|uniref:Uncharacterized protein n=1 Tax=Dendrothele bispora (strain CBS 962.96) TaxID=1314807 RepID=A0A4S8L0J9_DENBC|nr:hypothetical protein K435DRAFT_808831 [Dendrothele bispora CBS 962.96]